MDAEKRFKQISKIIDEKTKDSNQKISDKIFDEYDKEYIKLKKIYKDNKISFNFVRYNYYLRKVYQKENDYNSTINYSLCALLAFLDINTQKPDIFLYNISKMINSIKIENVQNIKYITTRMTESIKYIKENNKKYDDIKKEQIVNIYFSYFGIITQYIDTLTIKEKKDNDDINGIRIVLKSLFTELQLLKRDLKTSSILAELIYKIGKKQSIYILRFMFFEEREEYRNNMKAILKETIEDMEYYSKQSLKITRKEYNKRGIDNDRVKLVLTLKEIDVKMANYFKQLYYDKNTNAAWKSINELKQYLINKILVENINISNKLMAVIVDECNLLQAFNKISLLKNEIYKLANNSKIDWIKETLNSINKEFEDIERLFKYDENKSSVTKLENIDDSFMGTLIEYMLHDLLNYIKDNNNVVKSDLTDEILSEIYECEEIKLNNIIENGKPDIDIDLCGKTAVLIKNAKIKNEECKTIEGELEIVSRCLKYSKCYYLINFSKNIENMFYLKSKFNDYKDMYNIDIALLDVKDFYDRVINFLKKPTAKYNFSINQLYKMFGY